MLKDFKDFILRGRIVDLAVAVVVGGAFAQLIAALVGDLLTPLIAAIFGQPNFKTLHFSIGHSIFEYGLFLNALITFLTVAAAMFFFVLKPLTALMHRVGMMPDDGPTKRPCPECTTTIPEAAIRCPQCTAVLARA